MMKDVKEKDFEEREEKDNTTFMLMLTMLLFSSGIFDNKPTMENNNFLVNSLACELSELKGKVSVLERMVNK